MEAIKVFFAGPQTSTSDGPATTSSVGPTSAPLGGNAGLTEGAATSVPTEAPPVIPADDLLHLEDESSESAKGRHQEDMRTLVNAMKAFHIVNEDDMKAFDRSFPVAQSPRKDRIDVPAILDEDIPNGVLFQYPLVSSNLTGYVHDVDLPRRTDLPMLVKPGVDEETLDSKLESLRKSRIVPSQSPWALELYSALEHEGSMNKAEDDAALVDKNVPKPSDLIEFGAPVKPPADVLPNREIVVAPTSSDTLRSSSDRVAVTVSDKNRVRAPSTRRDLRNDHQQELKSGKVAVTTETEKNKVIITPVPVKGMLRSDSIPGGFAVGGGGSGKEGVVAPGSIKSLTALAERPKTLANVAAINRTQETEAKDGPFNKSLSESRWAPGSPVVNGSEDKGTMAPAGSVKGLTALVEQPKTLENVAAVDRTQESKHKDGPFDKSLSESRWAPGSVRSEKASDVRHAKGTIPTATPPPRVHTPTPTTPIIGGGLSQSRWAPGGRGHLH